MNHIWFLFMSFPTFITGLRIEILNGTYADLGTYCGEGEGSAFNDSSYYEAHGLPTKIGLSAGNVIDSIQMWYGGVEAPRHGGSGGDAVEHPLGDREYISGIKMRQGEEDNRDPFYVCQITFYLTNLDTGAIDTWGPFGRCEKDDEGCDEYHSLYPMKYITGRSGSLLDNLVAVF